MAQRIARQALGTLISNPTVGTLAFTEDDNFSLEWLSDEELLAFQKLFNKGHAYGETTRRRDDSVSDECR